MHLLAQLLDHAHRARWVLATFASVVLGTLAALVVLIVMTVMGSRRAAIALLPLSVFWVLVNGPVEGPTLLVLSPEHGVTTADLLSVTAVVVAMWRLVLTPKGSVGFSHNV